MNRDGRIDNVLVSMMENAHCMALEYRDYKNILSEVLYNIKHTEPETFKRILTEYPELEGLA